MDPIQTITVIIFAVTIVLVIGRWVDSVVAALVGVIAMVMAGSMTEVEAFAYVDWNVITILVSIWLIAGYFGKTGIPEYLGDMTLRWSRGNVPLFVTLIGALSGFISMFIDNVVVVLMLAPVVFHIRKLYSFEATGAILFIGLCSNFMGTALLLGDLPPQMLHSVSGVEFLGFHLAFGPTVVVYHSDRHLCGRGGVFLRQIPQLADGPGDAGSESADRGGRGGAAHQEQALRVGGVRGLPAHHRRHVDARGVRGVAGLHRVYRALLLVLVFEIFGKAWRLDAPSLEQMLAELDWKAIGFYVALFALVGGLESVHILEFIAGWLVPYIETSLLLGTSILYWVTAAVVGVVEHDAFILTMLYVIRDLGGSHGIDPWPLYWALVWAGTLGSNLTIAGAPALYVALTMGEKEDGRNWSLKEFLSFSVPYVVISLVVCYLLLVLIWVLPFM